MSALRIAHQKLHLDVLIVAIDRVDGMARFQEDRLQLSRNET